MTKMKDSGIDWIGEIPEEWGVSKLKYLLSNELNNIKVGPFGSALAGDDIKSEGKWIYNQRNVLDNNFEETDSYIDEVKWQELRNFSVMPGDILLTTRGTIGKVAIVPEKYSEGIIHPCLIRFRIEKSLYHSDLIKYIFNSTNIIKKQLDFMSNSTTIDVIYSYNLRNIYLPVIPIQEQDKIIEFLNKKVAQLDKVKALLEDQIATLQDYRQSLIYETVTKGLDKTAPLKDSGVDWIGQIPERWEIGRLKHFYNIFAGGDIQEDNFSSEYTEKFCYPVLSNSKENNGIFGYSDIFRFDKETVTVTGRGDIGYAEYRDYRHFPIIRLLVCVPYVSVDGRFTAYWINSSVIEKNQTAIPQLTRFTLGELPFPKISLGEQIEIADYLDKKVNQINQMIDIKQKQIDNINQQRQTLIYDFVTGKRRV